MPFVTLVYSDISCRDVGTEDIESIFEDDKYDDLANFDFSLYYTYGDVSNIGYVKEDINGDGFIDLIIGENLEDRTIIYNLYLGRKFGAEKSLIKGDDAYKYYVLEDGEFVEEYKSEFEEYLNFYVLNEDDELEKIRGFYHTSGENFDDYIKTEENQDEYIDKETFESAINSEYKFKKFDLTKIDIKINDVNSKKQAFEDERQPLTLSGEKIDNGNGTYTLNLSWNQRDGIDAYEIVIRESNEETGEYNEINEKVTNTSYSITVSNDVYVSASIRAFKKDHTIPYSAIYDLNTFDTLLENLQKIADAEELGNVYSDETDENGQTATDRVWALVDEQNEKIDETFEYSGEWSNTIESDLL